ncbi:MAG: hypothetical protein MHPSP_003514 [Paramarteilia canceri]
MVGMHETQKSSIISKVFKDAFKCESSCIFIDDFERIIEYVDFGPRFSNNVLQTFLTYLKTQPPPGKHLLLIVTSSRIDLINQLGIFDQFSSTIKTPTINKKEQLKVVLSGLNQELATASSDLLDCSDELSMLDVGVKQVVELCEISQTLPKTEQAAVFVSNLEHLTNRILQNES